MFLPNSTFVDDLDETFGVAVQKNYTLIAILNDSVEFQQPVIATLQR
jgi:hypothetical protein